MSAHLKNISLAIFFALGNAASMACAPALAFQLASVGTAGQAHASADTQTPSKALMRNVATSLSRAPVISGRFEQTKTIAGFKHPLVSSGEFAAARNAGILWHTRMPFESLLAITERRIMTQHGSDASQTLLGGDDEPVLRMVNELLFAIMTADLALLSQRFEMSGEQLESSQWTLSLTPREPALQQWIQHVQLWGDTYVRKVVLLEAQGDEAVILFSEHAAGSKVPDALQ